VDDLTQGNDPLAKREMGSAIAGTMSPVIWSAITLTDLHRFSRFDQAAATAWRAREFLAMPWALLTRLLRSPLLTNDEVHGVVVRSNLCDRTMLRSKHGTMRPVLLRPSHF